MTTDLYYLCLMKTTLGIVYGCSMHGLQTYDGILLTIIFHFLETTPFVGVIEHEKFAINFLNAHNSNRSGGQGWSLQCTWHGMFCDQS